MVGYFAAGSGKYQYRKKACLKQVIKIHYPCSSALFGSVVGTSPKLTLMATLIGEVHSNFGIRNSVCRLLRILLRRI